MWVDHVSRKAIMFCFDVFVHVPLDIIKTLFVLHEAREGSSNLYVDVGPVDLNMDVDWIFHFIFIPIRGCTGLCCV